MNKEILKESMIIALIVLLGLIAIGSIIFALAYFLKWWGLGIVCFIIFFVAITYSVYDFLSRRNNEDNKE